MQPQQCSKELGLLGNLCLGVKKLEGKIFYLDNLKKRSLTLLLEAISILGGRVESFLHKDVSFFVTGSQEGPKEEKCVVTKDRAKGTSEGTQQRPGTPRPVACGSRGKALLEKAIRNNERLQGSSVLSNARSWGVKILYVDDVLLYLKQLTRESFSAKSKRPERTSSKQHSLPCVKVTATSLRLPCLKIEDSSRKYKPLHIQSTTFPTLCYVGRFSPFELPPPRFEKQTEQGENKTREKKVESSIQDKSQTALSCNPSPWRQRKKDTSYCECCRQPFTNLEEHLQSDQHRTFVLNPSNYSVMDQLVVNMLPGFDPNPSRQSDETLNRPPTPLPVHGVCELEPLTDVETERAVQALRRQSSSIDAHISNPPRGPFSSGPDCPSPGVQFAIPNPATLPADIESLIPETDCHFPEIQTRASSSAMPVLYIEPQAQDSLNQQPEDQHLSSGPSAPCPLYDPYALPPVLSPQVPYSSYIMDPQSPYPEPPVLSPQQYTTEEGVTGQTCETSTEEIVSRFVSGITVPSSTRLLGSVAAADTEGIKGSYQLVELSGLVCSNRGLKCARLSPRRSHSLPRQSAVVPNPRKRCRTASPDHSRSKRKRTATFGSSGSWTAQSFQHEKPQSESLAKVEDCLLSEKASYQKIQPCPNLELSWTSSTNTVDMLGLKWTNTKFCFPTIQNFTQPPNQVDSVNNQPSRIFDPSLDFPNSKSHCAFSSQDSRSLSQHSLSHSTSVGIDSALIPDVAALSRSSDSDWDCDLLSRLGPTSARLLKPTEQSCELDKELLHRPCTWMRDTSYESHLHTVLQPSAPATSLCGEETDPSTFSRTVVQIVKVHH
ncbi:uncharacterized protein dbf4b [Embiotoca jacksoni]|uniref:uncharacterized protein dbf4b n=1 Tax=Embiotoca jacksoni TaxID=100190 RepID=UPI003703BFAD